MSDERKERFAIDVLPSAASTWEERKAPTKRVVEGKLGGALFLRSARASVGGGPKSTKTIASESE